MTFEKFLNTKPLFYKEINYDTIYLSWEILSKYIKLPFVIHIIGTNGKGSTGRYLSYILWNNGYKTLHYSSPHIVKFNERIWINGENSSDKQLEKAHQKLQEILPEHLLQNLTYFEYTTLMALYLSNDLDYLVLEAGLGGEFDATNIVTNDLTLITTIGLDHTEFLGDTIEKIATTKMKSCDKAYIIGKQTSNIDVYNVEQKILKNKKKVEFLNTIQLNEKQKQLPKFLQNNLKLVLSALEYLKVDIKDYSLPILFGRCEKLNSNITIDVGHNSLAATVLLREFIHKKVILVYNSYKDKDILTVLQILKPIIKEVQIISIDDERIIEPSLLHNILDKLGIKYCDFDINNMNNDENYLVFGSFKVVEEFLKQKGRCEK